MFSAEFRELMDTLADEEYRREFVSENIATGLAFQIRHLRDSRGWTQEELAKRIGKTRQETISQWENPNYGRYSVSTLKKLAVAFDVALSIRFTPFSELANWILHLSPDRLAPASFDGELLQELARVPTTTASVGDQANEFAIVPHGDIYSTESPSIQVRGNEYAVV